jgi:NADH:ubiquinone oxidoreductase subunit F (NADH-binding)
VPLSQPLARDRGVSLGAGVVALLPDHHCGVGETARILRYLADSSARQCGPCLFGLDDLAALMERVADGSSRRGDLRRIERFSAQIVGRGGCHHPDGAVRMLASALEVFGRDVHAHTKQGRCRHSLGHTLVPIPEAV